MTLLLVLTACGAGDLSPVQSAHSQVQESRQNSGQKLVFPRVLASAGPEDTQHILGLFQNPLTLTNQRGRST